MYQDFLIEFFFLKKLIKNVKSNGPNMELRGIPIVTQAVLTADVYQMRKQWSVPKGKATRTMT